MDHTGLGNDFPNPRDKPALASSGWYNPRFGKLFYYMLGCYFPGKENIAKL